MPETITAFDIAEHLETDADIQDFLRETAIAARAKGMGEVAKQAGVTRASLYKSLADDGNPRFETITKIVEALGCKLVVS